MAVRKMTFTIPEELADVFVRRIPARERSRYLAQALEHKLGQSERQLIRACELANHDPEVLAMEQEWDALLDEIPERW